MGQRAHVDRASDANGFTLVETLVAVAILGVILPTIFGTIVFLARGTRDAQSRLRDSRAVMSVVDYYKRTYSVLSTPAPGYTGAIVGTVHDPVVGGVSVAGIDQVTVSVSRSDRTVTYTFLWPKNGG